MMRSCSDIQRPIYVAIVFYATLLSVQITWAGTGAETFVSPAKADSLTSSVTFRNIQTSTEAETTGLFTHPTSLPMPIYTGINSYVSDRNLLFDVPLIAAITPDLQVRLDIPFVSTTTDVPNSGSRTDTGIGDILFSIKYRTDIIKMLESYFIFTTQFPSGDADRGLGTGTFNFSLTHKTIIMLGAYRTTFMAGLTLTPPSSATILGSTVEFGPTVSYMAATERALASTDFIFGLKAAGLHAFNSKIDSIEQKNAVTTLDIIPEVTYRISDSGSVKAGVIIPLLTIYDLPGSTNRRDPAISISFNRFF